MVAAQSEFCLRPLEDWLLEPEFFACWENEAVRPGLIATGALGARTGHPFIGQILQDIRDDPDPFGGMAWQKLGPQRITDTYRRWKNRRADAATLADRDAATLGHADVTIYPSHYFLPEHYSGIKYEGAGPVFARQLWGSTRGSYGQGTWHGTAGINPAARQDEAAARWGSRPTPLAQRKSQVSRTQDLGRPGGKGDPTTHGSRP